MSIKFNIPVIILLTLPQLAYLNESSSSTRLACLYAMIAMAVITVKALVTFLLIKVSHNAAQCKIS